MRNVCSPVATVSRVLSAFIITMLILVRTGVAAPVLAGALLSISPSLPVFVSAAVFCVTAACSLALPFERIADGKSRAGAAMAH